jgi:hypothetical protein
LLIASVAKKGSQEITALLLQETTFYLDPMIEPVVTGQ